MNYSREWEKIISEGEFSTRNNDVSVVFIHEGIEYPVSCFDAKAWKRREVDKQLLSDIPSETRSILIAADSIPSNIPVEDYPKLTVVIDGEYLSVMFRTGTDLLRFFLKGVGELGPEDEADMVVDDDIGFEGDMPV